VSEAYTALDRLYEKLTDDRDLLSLVVIGASEENVSASPQRRIGARRGKSSEAMSAASALPPIWPDPANQKANLTTLAALAPKHAPEGTMQAGGFNDEAFALTKPC